MTISGDAGAGFDTIVVAGNQNAITTGAGTVTITGGYGSAYWLVPVS